jgi:hypothetical protein
MIGPVRYCRPLQQLVRECALQKLYTTERVAKAAVGARVSLIREGMLRNELGVRFSSDGASGSLTVHAPV